MRIAVYSEQLANLGGAEKYGLLLVAPLVGAHAVTVFHRSKELDYPRLLRERFDLEMGSAGFEYVHSRRAALRAMRGADLVVNITDASLLRNPGRRGVLCVYFPIPLDDFPARDPLLTRTVAMARGAVMETIVDRFPSVMVPAPVGFREYSDRHGRVSALVRCPVFLLRSLAWRGAQDRRYGVGPVGTYDRILACSRFGGEWVRRNYGVKGEVLYPPIDTHLFRPGEKGREVIAVGRFDNSEKSKKFHVLIDMFKRLHAEGTLAGWTLHCCGGLHGAHTEAYLATLREQAAGYPVEFHADLPFSGLVRRYASASMFWHAMGYGEDPNRHPWRFEHFGMTTAEAMAAGCVPVVIDAGGQPEIVTDSAQGYRWSTLDEFAEAVRGFVRLSPDEVAAIRRAARERAEFFGRRAFFERAAELYAELRIPCRPAAELCPTSTPASG